MMDLGLLSNFVVVKNIYITGFSKYEKIGYDMRETYSYVLLKLPTYEGIVSEQIYFQQILKKI